MGHFGVKWVLKWAARGAAGKIYLLCMCELMLSKSSLSFNLLFSFNASKKLEMDAMCYVFCRDYTKQLRIPEELVQVYLQIFVIVNE